MDTTDDVSLSHPSDTFLYKANLAVQVVVNNMACPLELMSGFPSTRQAHALKCMHLQA